MQNLERAVRNKSTASETRFRNNGTVSGEQQTGSNSLVKIGSARVKSILEIMLNTADKPGFFNDGLLGVACLSGFLEFDAAGNVKLVPHHPSQPTRHIIQAECRGADWDYYTPLLTLLFDGSFKDDEDKDQRIDLIGELCGAALLGIGVRGVTDIGPARLALAAFSRPKRATGFQVSSAGRSFAAPSPIPAIASSRSRKQRGCDGLPFSRSSAHRFVGHALLREDVGFRMASTFLPDFAICVSLSFSIRQKRRTGGHSFRAGSG